MYVDNQKETELRVLDEILKSYKPHQEYRDQSAAQFEESTGLNRYAAQRALRNIVAAGILTRRLEYGQSDNELGPGRHYHWTLHVEDRDAALKLLEPTWTARAEAWSGKGQRSAETRRKNEQAKEDAAMKRSFPISAAEEEVVGKPVDYDFGHPVTIASRDEEVTRAIAGPEVRETLADVAPVGLRALRKDESVALIEAARQYHNRNGAVHKKLDELAALADEIGITFSKEKALESIQFDTDDRLEAISLVLPYIDGLVARNDSLVRTIADQSDKVRRFGEIDAENVRLRRRNAELTNARVSNAVATSASH